MLFRIDLHSKALKNATEEMQSMELERTPRQPLFVWSLISASILAAFCYLPGLSAAYMFDSVPWLERNDSLRDVSPTFATLYQASFSAESGPLGRSLSMFSFAIEAVLTGGLRPQVSNAVNVAIHLLNGFLLFQVLSQLARPARSAIRPSMWTLPNWVPLVVTTFWILHPLHVSTVLYAVQRMALLASTGVLLGTWLYLRQRVNWLSQAPKKQPLAELITSIAVCTLAAGLAKENGLLLPLFIAFIEIYCFRCVVGGTQRRLLCIACMLLLAAPMLAAALAVLLAPGVVEGWYANRDFNLGERLLTQARVLWHYMEWICLPNLRELAFYHDDIPISRNLLEPVTTSLAIAAWVGVAGVAWFLRDRCPVLLFALGWFLIAHSIESTVVPLELVFEHRNYLAAVGPITAISVLVLKAFHAVSPKLRNPVFLIFTSVFSFLLFLRTQYWGDEFTLAAHHLRFHPQSERAVFHYANVNLQRGEALPAGENQAGYIMTARRYYERLLELNETSIVALSSLLYIDAAWFPGKPSRDATISRIMTTIRSRVIDASEHNSLAMLVDCVNSGPCRQERQALAKLLEAAYTTNCCSKPFVAYQKARLYAGLEEDPRQALKYARYVTKAYPEYLPAYALEAELHLRLGSRGAAAETLGEWSRKDPHGKQLSQIAEAFK